MTVVIVCTIFYSLQASEDNEQHDNVGEEV